MPIRRWVGLAVFAGCLIGAPPVDAQIDDLTSMSLEELMDLEIVPIGILDSHIHLDGQWMVGYQYMRMNMTAVDHSHGSYMMRPTSMWMDMHMVMLMYGLTDDLTLMAMIPYGRAAMEMTSSKEMEMSSSSEGLRDIRLMGHYALIRQSKSYLIGGAGLTVPTGTTEQASDSRRLGYGMQLGAGVPEFILDFILVRQADRVNTGAHAEGQWSLGRNRHGYRIGDRYHAGAWVTMKTATWFAPSLHLDVEHQLEISGSDPEIAVGMSPANDPDNYGGTHVSIEPGITLYAPHGALEGQRLSLRFHLPVLEWHSSRFLEEGWTLNTGWQWTF